MRGRWAMLVGGVTVALGLSGTAQAAASPWTPVASPDAPRGAKATVEASRFSSHALDQRALERTLAGAALEGRGKATVVQVPAPSGRLKAFAVRESPVLQPELAAENPQIKTYSGRGVDDPTASIRLDVTPLGFHASVLAQRGAWYVDPFSFPERGVYASYWKRDLPADSRGSLGEEELVDDMIAQRAGRTSDAGGLGPHARGGAVVQRVYRTAIASDPSYAAFFGGGDANVLAAKTTLINRVNQVYNDDLAVKLVLINDTNLLNFETEAEYSGPNGPCGAAPCYTADAGCDSALLYDNSIALGQVVGASKFDVGHLVLGVNGGGIAGLGVVGGDRKAQGCTGTPTPVNDPFAIDYVAHEFGHQFGSNHTFNGVQGACGNRVVQTSVEPGSGSTVMGYAGICGQDDLQPLSDAYFSQRSIKVITDYVTSAEPAVGEIQTASFTGFGGSDSFRIGYGGNTSVLITNGSNYTKAGVKAAIQGIPGWPAGATVTVYGYEATSDNPSPAGFQVYFGGAFGGVDVSALSIESASGFTGFVGETAQGGPAANGGVATATTNAPPVVSAPADETIPVRTPFELAGQGTDADGDPLIYLWEQNDQGVGPGTALFSNSKTNGPLFRVGSVASSGSGAATSTPVRSFPDLAQIAAGNTNAATGTCGATDVTCFSEFLPTSAYAAQMNFRLTARDRAPMGGGVAHDDVTLTLADSAGPFRVTSHGASATLQGGAPTEVTWNVAGTAGAPVSAANVEISFSSDGGLTYPTVLQASTPNDGSATVTVPNLDTSTARFRVKAVGNVFFDVSHANVSVESGGGGDTTPPQTSIDSGPGEGSTTNDATPQFTFSSSEAGSTFECQIDGAGFSACSSPHTTAELANGQHTFAVRATDAAGNTDASPATRTFTVDTGGSGDTDPPETTIVFGPEKKKIKLKKGKRRAKVIYEYGSDENPVTYQCNINSSGWQPCFQATLYKLGKGRWTLEARAVDAAGNADPTPVSDTIKVKKKRRKK